MSPGETAYAYQSFLTRVIKLEELLDGL